MKIVDLVRAGLREGGHAEGESRIWLAAAGMAFFALAWAAVERLGAYAGVPPTQVVWMRYSVQILLLVTVFGPRAGRRIAYTRRLSLQIVRSLLMLVMPLSFIAAARFLPIRDVEAVFWLGIAAFASLRALQARGAAFWLCILSPALAAAGALLLLQPIQLPMRLSLVLPLMMAASYLLYQILTRSMKDESEISKLFHTAVWVFLSLSIFVPFRWHAPSRTGWVAAIAIGVLGCGALFALDIAVRFASPLQVAAVSFLQPLFAAGAAVLLDGGTLSGHLLAGGACIILAALMGLAPVLKPRTAEVT